MSHENPILVDYEFTDGLARITLNRPDKRNALDASTATALADAFERAEAEQARVAILSGRGKVFSAGADLDALRRLLDAGHDDNLRDSRTLATMFRTMRGVSYPIIAAVHGAALGGGAGLVAASDLAVAAYDTTLGFTEVNLGFVPAIVMTFVLRRLRGSDARDLLLTGRRFTANEALELGLVNVVVQHDALDDAAEQLAKPFLERTSRQAVAATRKLIDELWGKSLDEALEHAAEANARARGTSDFRDGVSAFLGRRDPPWTPRDDSQD